MTDSTFLLSAYDVVIIGAGAAGMMAAIESGKRGRKTLIIDHAKSVGEKIRISGGGRCNFTNLHTSPENFLSQNPHFCKSALSRYTQHDFIKWIEHHHIAYHEKTLGQLFCDHSAKDIIQMLLTEMTDMGVDLRLQTSVTHIEKTASGFALSINAQKITCDSLVVATGGLSIPKMGATGFGYDIAKQFHIPLIPTRAGLVPLLFDKELLALTKPMSGVSIDPARVSCHKTDFSEAILLTHKGISGPAILQISSYWLEGAEIILNLLPTHDIYDELRILRDSGMKTLLHNALASFLPRRLAEMIVAEYGLDVPVVDLSDKKIRVLADMIHAWRVTPIGSEGYRTAEVTLGGVDTNALSSKTMEAKDVAGLYFIGEVVDVTGWLGGYNFQWAWSSGWVAGQYC